MCAPPLFLLVDRRGNSELAFLVGHFNLVWEQQSAAELSWRGQHADGVFTFPLPRSFDEETFPWVSSLNRFLKTMVSQKNWRSSFLVVYLQDLCKRSLFLYRWSASFNSSLICFLITKSRVSTNTLTVFSWLTRRWDSCVFCLVVAGLKSVVERSKNTLARKIVLFISGRCLLSLRSHHAAELVHEESEHSDWLAERY